MIEPERLTLTNGDGILAADVYGADASSTVVMLPSFARGAGDFTPAFGSDLAERVADAGHQVVLPWPRGFSAGPSTGDVADATMASMATDVGTLINAIGPGPVTVLGHAFGQRIARMLATIAPELVDRLVLVAAGGITPTSAEVTAAVGTLVFDREATRDERLDALRSAFFAPGNDPSVWLEGWSAQLGAAQWRANQPGLVATWWAGGGVVPMFVVQGGDDTAAPAEASSARLLADFPDRVEVVTVETVGHAMLPERPVEVSAAVLDFLAR